MRAMVIHKFGRPLELETVPTPQPGPGQVLVQVRACGLCGTDVKVADGKHARARLPLIPGHELAGVVQELGPDARGVSVGEHVVIHTYVSCLRCRFCRAGLENYCVSARQIGTNLDGGFGEYVVAPDRNCYPVAPSIPFEQACLLSGSVGTPFHALRKQGRLTAGDTVVIFGAGGLGLHAVQLARALGAQVIATDVDDEKLELARSMGAIAGLNPRHGPIAPRVRELTDGEGAAVVVPVVGGQALPAILEDAFGSLRPRGRFVLLGYLGGVPLAVDSHRLVTNGWEIRGSRSCTSQDLKDVIKLVESGRMTPVVARTLPVESVNEALDLLRAGGPAGRIVLIHDGSKK